MNHSQQKNKHHSPVTYKLVLKLQVNCRNYLCKFRTKLFKFIIIYAQVQ